MTPTITSVGDLVLTGGEVTCGLCGRPLHLRVSPDGVIRHVTALRVEDGLRVSQGDEGVIHHCHGRPDGCPH